MRRRRGRVARAVKLFFVSAREFGLGASAAFENVVAEMEAFDAGVDTARVQSDDDFAAPQPETVGPYGRHGPMDDRSPVLM